MPIGNDVFLFALIVESLTILVLPVGAKRYSKLSENLFPVLRIGFNRIARRQGLAVLFAMICGGLIAASFSIFHLPAPVILDEHCYLLAADTFAHGRLTNPPHPFWPHFENIFILQTPSYQAKYMPAQGLLLAFGQLVGGHPVVGVWSGTALACAATCWMLQAWLPPRWALFGGLLPVTRFGIFLTDHMQWSRSYWGGMLAVAGGALLFGAMRRIVRAPTCKNSAIMAGGLSLLALTRPFEGSIAGLAACSCLAYFAVVRKDSRWRVNFLRSTGSALVVLATSAAFLMYYNYRVTGEPLRLPYVEHAKQYNPIPNFVWGSLDQWKSYRHQQIRNFYESPTAFDGLARQYQTRDDWPGRVRHTLTKLGRAWIFLLGPALTVPLLLSFRELFRGMWNRFAAGTVLVGVVVFVVVNWDPIHYLAPFTCLMLYLSLQSLRCLGRLEVLGTRPVREFTQGVLIAICCLSFVLALMELFVWSSQQAPTERERIEAQLEQLPGRHLVMVRYAPDQASGTTWMYNSANIDAQPVVWAREMTPGENRQLMQYFQDRSVWLLQADQSPAQVETVAQTIR